MFLARGAGSRLSGHDKDPVFREFYDDEATAEKSAIAGDTTVKQRDDTNRLMLQTLLAERFKLVIRREVRDNAVYAAVVGKGGLKLEASKLNEETCPDGNGDGPHCHGIQRRHGTRHTRQPQVLTTC